MGKGSRRLVYVLLSGGIDSTACVQFYRDQEYRVKPLHIQYGQGAHASELRSARAVAQFYKLKLLRVDLSGLEPAISGDIPGRNTLLLSTGLMSMGARTGLVALGIHAGTRYFDCQPTFVRLWDQLLDGYTDGRIRLGTPFLSWKKSEIWQYCLKSDVPVSLTWSCESRSGRPCGRCASCKDKEALIARS
jgi:7-cyano-7-deazaguanine synthase